eukprot:CAMPEP_0170544010 /NCGR_PEP_ID=MMETSP0211-20121228/2928_1 /TAXON_ID=311385 /ORGANISM="Pseudokeronopsis sp., Strain OXSARD2" /LENGTH=50 /DNA_ID=CAMNT_0010847545 /DNA_START=453 /DNA_END=602 /DNA_ORIENTATION=-
MFNLVKLKLTLKELEAVKYLNQHGSTPQFNIDGKTKISLESSKQGKPGDT